MDWPVLRSLLRFGLLLQVLFSIVTRITVLTHELLGHALLAVLVGAKCEGIHLTFFEGGAVNFHLADTSWWRAFVVQGGGISLDLIFGSLVLLWATRIQRPILQLAVTLAGEIWILGAIFYLTCGLYFGWGDPTSMALLLEKRFAIFSDPREQGLWIPFLAMAPMVSYLVMRPYCVLQEAQLPSRTFLRRIVFAGLTLGVALATHVGLGRLEQAWTGDRDFAYPINMQRLAEREAASRLRSQQFHDIVMRLKAEHLPTTELGKRAFAEVNALPNEVPKLEDVKPLLPMVPLVLLAFASGGIAALRRLDRRSMLS